MRTMIGIAIALVVAAGCKGKAKDGGATGAAGGGDVAAAPREAADGGAAGGGSAAGDAGVEAPRAPVIPRDEVDALVARWLEAQNGGDFAAYGALYADDFKGVRRSGKQTVRLDRAGWLEDRKKMFARPMTVAISDVQVVLAPTKAVVRFTQEWASGRYRDVGPKVIEVAAAGGALRIAREELLASRIVKPAPAGDAPRGARAVWPAFGDVVVLAGEVEPGWAKGRPELRSGPLPRHDPSCERRPPDYEREQDRYWQCASTDPRTGTIYARARQAVAVERLPPELAAWVGREVRLVGPKGTCTAKVTQLAIHAERETTIGQISRDGRGERAVAGVVMETGEPVLAGVLDGGCAAWWATPADAPEAVAWRREPAADALAHGVIDRLIVEQRDGGNDVQVSLLTGPGGRTLALAWFEDHFCEPLGLHVLYAVEGNTVVGDALLDVADPTSLVAVIDADGDGWPELVFGDGIAARDPEDGAYTKDRMIRFPDEIADCGD